MLPLYASPFLSGVSLKPPVQQSVRKPDQTKKSLVWAEDRTSQQGCIYEYVQHTKETQATMPEEETNSYRVQELG